MEAFDITFFCKKRYCNDQAHGDINVSMKLLHSLDENNFGIYMDGTKELDKRFGCYVYDFDDVDYMEYSASIQGLKIRENTFEEIIKVFAIFVGDVLRKIRVFSFATAIYERTCSLIEDEEKFNLDEFDPAFLSKFPLLFLRPEADLSEYIGKVVYKDEYIICLYNEKAQDIFAIM